MLKYYSKIGDLRLMRSIWITLFVVCCIDIWAVEFKQLDLASGLSTSKVNTIFQDKTGYIWIGTDNGINRYDGYRIVNFLYDAQDSHSVLGNSCNFISQDEDGNLWVGTELGVSMHDKTTDSFIQFPLYDLDNKVFHIDVYAFIKDLSGKYLLLSNDNLYIFDDILEVSPTLKGFRTTEFNAFPIKNSRGMVADDNGLYYIVTEGNGVVVFDSNTKRIVTNNRFTAENAHPTKFLKSIFKDPEGRKWISTMSEGFFILDKNDKLVTPSNISPLFDSMSRDRDVAVNQCVNGDVWCASSSSLKKIDYQTKESTTYSISSEKNQFQVVRCVLPDRSGNVWIGTTSNGVLLYTPSDFAQNFTTLSTTSEPLKLSNSSVLSILKLEDGNLLVGTDWGGLNVFDYRQEVRTVLTHNDLDPTSLPNDAVTALFKDSYGEIWVGTYLGGLSKLNLKTHKFTPVNQLMATGEVVHLMYVTDIYEDAKHNLWVATNGSGLFVLNRLTNTFVRYLNSSLPKGEEVSTNNTLQVLQDDDTHYWIASYYGLNRLDIKSNRFEYFFADSRVKNAISHNWILCMAYDTDGQLWLGTSNGLNRYHKATNDFTVYLEKDGLPGNIIHSIVADNLGYLWISTNKGIARFNKKTDTFDNFYKSDGLTGNEFLGRASFYDSKGELFFGSTTGLNSFYPTKLKVFKESLEVFFTSLSVVSSTQLSLNKDINSSRFVELDYNQTNIAIEFSTLSFSQIDQIKYLYQMEGIDTTWISLGSMRTLTFPKLPSGSYTLHVKASFTGNWKDAKVSSLKLIIHPPYYLSFWAWVVYLLIFLASFYFYQRFMRRNALIKNRLQMAELEQQKAVELYNEKLSFFSNISHELKTPLTIILGYTEKLLAERTDDPNLTVLKRNTTKLQRRIEQLLDFQKVDSGVKRLNLQYNDIVGYLRLIMNEFSYEATLHNIEYTFMTNKKELRLLFDTEIIDKIVSNLLSNAFKFTPEGGAITVTLHIMEIIERGEIDVKIVVEDSGVGISDEDLPFVFDRFFSKPGLSSHKGTGIGLALAHELALMHQGDVIIDSSAPKGTRFVFNFSVKSDTMTGGVAEPSFTEFIHKSSLVTNIKAVTVAEPNSMAKSLSMLIVDDHEDMRQYIGDIFQKEYNILFASDGEKGLELAHRYQPDIIITDVMMPIVDGLELCRKIKVNVALSHIPIIIVTAVFSESKKIEGLEFGADDYINKPFNSKVLELKVRNIMARKERASNYLKSADTIDAEMITTNLTDKIFMERLISLIEKNASDSEFGIQQIIAELALSKSVFYRKVKSITNESVVDLIRTVRLKKAARLLISTSLSVNEVAYQVGYSDAGYFIKVFKEFFNCTPGDYKR